MTTAELEQRIARLEAVHEIQNVMGRYSYWHTANMHRECLDLFALKTPGVRAEMMWGVYEGAESLERLYPGFHAWVDGDAKGVMHMHTLTTPVIEVAEDLRSARATWISPGHETMSFSAAGEDGAAGSATKSPEAFWAWCKYGCDFVVEDGRWKIWHLHVYGIFLAPYGRSWVEQPEDMIDPPPMLDGHKPDLPPTTHWQYMPDRVYPNEPAPPDPYPSFDEAQAY
jgi:SnoaL-like domain